MYWPFQMINILKVTIPQLYNLTMYIADKYQNKQVEY